MEIGVLGFICWVFFAGCNVFGAMDDGKMIISLLFQSEYMHLSILFDGVVMAVLFAMHCMYGFVPMLIMAFWLFMQMSFTVVALRPRAKDLSYQEVLNNGVYFWNVGCLALYFLC